MSEQEENPEDYKKILIQAIAASALKNAKFALLLQAILTKLDEQCPSQTTNSN